MSKALVALGLTVILIASVWVLVKSAGIDPKIYDSEE
jgi:hypothetical protein